MKLGELFYPIIACWVVVMLYILSNGIIETVLLVWFWLVIDYFRKNMQNLLTNDKDNDTIGV